MSCHKNHEETDKLTRIAIVNADRCKPKRCKQECKKSCPVVRMGKLCIEVTPNDKIATISEELCIGCGICVKLSQKMLEVCVDSVESMMNAMYGGADELELCSSLSDGGLTPTPGLVSRTLQLVDEYTRENDRKRPKLNVMIRCRAGSDFNYSQYELETMQEDIRFYKTMGVDRFVFGCLTEEGTMDYDSNATLIEEALPLPATFHRAYDVFYSPALEQIITLGFDRLLTSGKKICLNEKEAVAHIRRLMKTAEGRIDIVPGGGLTFENATTFLEMGCKILHSSCKTPVVKIQLDPSFEMEAYNMFVTDQVKVMELKSLMNVFMEKKAKEQLQLAALSPTLALNSKPTPALIPGPTPAPTPN